jgi:hypothetical protein
MVRGMKRVVAVLFLFLAACGSGEESTGDTGESSTSSSSTSAPADTTAPETTAAPATSEAPTTTAVEEPVALDCEAVDGILGLLWNDWATATAVSPAFASFTDELPTGQLRISAYDPSTRLIAGVWIFPDPQGDGLSQGIVWLDGAVVGDIYYLDGVDPLVEGDTTLLETGELLTLEIDMDGSRLIATGCWVGPKPPLVSPSSPLTIHGIGPISAGMTLAQVLNAVGDFPHDVSDQLDWADGYCYVLPLEDSGLWLQLEGLGPDASPLDAIVGAVVVFHGSYSTPSGMALGTSQADLEAALGDQLVISPHAYVDGTYHDFVPNDPDEQHLRLRFEVTGGVVTQMRAGLATSTLLVEGCS